MTPAELLRRAQAAGLLPADAAPVPDGGRPWPLTLLTAFGAWLAALPLLGALGLLLGDLLEQGIGPYLVGLALLALAWTLQRGRRPVFVEQLAQPLLLVACGMLALGLVRDLPMAAAGLLLALLVLGLAAVSPDRPWQQSLFGACAALLVLAAALIDHLAQPLAWWWSLHAVGAVGLLAWQLQARLPARALASVEAVAAGWLLATLAALALRSGSSFLVGAVAGDPAGPAGGWSTRPATGAALAGGSAALAVGAALWLARAWPSLRRPAWTAPALAAAGLCLFLPLLGALLAILAAACTGARWRLAAAAGAAAAWTVGSFYYELDWPLTTKALALAACGAWLGAAAWTQRRRPPGGTALASPARAARWGLPLCGAACLLLVNTGIWRNETLIAQGQPLYVALAPVDPRSLIQGDYMRLNFTLPPIEPTPLAGAERPLLALRHDARGVATQMRIATPGQPPDAEEWRIALTPKDGRWTLVTDAWFFAEGEGGRFAHARYGEFRVGPGGRALLVGLADEQLRPLR